MLINTKRTISSKFRRENRNEYIFLKVAIHFHPGHLELKTFIFTLRVLVMVIIRFRVQFVINLHECVFQKAEIARAAPVSAISAF